MRDFFFAESDFFCPKMANETKFGSKMRNLPPKTAFWLQIAPIIADIPPSVSRAILAGL